MSPQNISLWSEPSILEDLSILHREIVRSGRRVYDLSMVNPDLPPLRFLVDKLIEATMKPHYHRYSVARGVRKTREAFAVKYSKAFGVELNPDKQICVCMGTKDALMHLLICDEKASRGVLVGEPVYPAYISAIKFSRVPYFTFQLSHDEEAMLCAIEEKLRTTKARILILNFPNNPTGIAVSKSFYEKLGEIVERNDTFVIHDFVYGEMSFKGYSPSVLSTTALKNRAVEIYSLSKAYSVPGWRIGAVMGSEEVIGRFARLKSHVDYGIFLPIQLAASAALTSDINITGAITSEYEVREQTLRKGLIDLGWSITPSAGGASVWAKLPSDLRSVGSLAATRAMLSHGGVFGLPGVVFGSKYEEYIRFALVAPREDLVAACDLIELVQAKILPNVHEDGELFAI